MKVIVPQYSRFAPFWIIVDRLRRGKRAKMGSGTYSCNSLFLAPKCHRGEDRFAQSLPWQKHARPTQPANFRLSPGINHPPPASLLENPMSHHLSSAHLLHYPSLSGPLHRRDGPRNRTRSRAGAAGSDAISNGARLSRSSTLSPRRD